MDEKDSVWFINTPTIGFYTNLSRPIGDQTSPSECIMRHGPFFLERYVCIKQKRKGNAILIFEIQITVEGRKNIDICKAWSDDRNAFVFKIISIYI